MVPQKWVRIRSHADNANQNRGLLTEDNMGLDARKPVFGGLRTTQAQTSLRIRAV